jgi:wyosine [tRNA(Phe)-imidazoG37] synthetase (radical SAM superfamily)
VNTVAACVFTQCLLADEMLNASRRRERGLTMFQNRKHKRRKPEPVGCVFGPVPSRRLGRSLGVDLVPFKTCTYDCIYCQLGRTTRKTVERKEWVPLDGVLDEVRSRLSSRPDYITLSGSGEPTLYSRLGDLIDRIKGMTGVPVALLTNGSLLWRLDVLDEIQDIDLLIPSLDAGDERRFCQVSRPHHAISFDRMVDGLLGAREVCRGKYWLEVLVMMGYTTSDADVRRLAHWAKRIKPDRIQLNTVTRPPAERFAEGVPRDRLNALAYRFDPPAEVIADRRDVRNEPQYSAGLTDILNLLRRRPCSVEDLAVGLGMNQNEVVKYVEVLQTEKLLETAQTFGRCYYRATDRNARNT